MTLLLIFSLLLQVPAALADGLPDFRLGINTQSVGTGIEFIPKEPLNKNPKLKFRPAESIYAGIILGWRWIGGTLSFAVPASAEVRDTEGRSKYRDLRFTYYTHRFAMELGYNWFYRYILDGSNPIEVTEDFETRGFGANVFYAVDKNDFQLSSSLDQSDIQTKSAGSWLLMLSLRDQFFSSHNPILPARHAPSFGEDMTIRQAHGRAISAGGGYCYNLIFLESFFVAPALMATIGGQQMSYILADGAKRYQLSPGANLHIRLGLGWNSRNFFTTLNAYTDRYSNFTKTIELGSNIYGTTLALGIRF